MITALVSCTAQALTESQRSAISARRIEWVILHRRLGRVLLDMIAEREDLQWLVGRLSAAGLDPKVIAAFRADTGRRIRQVPIDRVEYLRVAPDVVTVDAQGVVTTSRPTDYVQTHTWPGWAGHTDEEEA